MAKLPFRHGEKRGLEISLMARQGRRQDGVALYCSANDERGNLGLFCSGLGVQRISQAIRGRTLADHAVVLVDEGAGWLESKAAGRLAVTAPALFWLQPGVPHGYGPHAGTAWHEHWVLFRGALADAIVNAGLFDPRRPLFTLPDAAEPVDLFGVLHSDFVDQDAFGALAAAADLHRLLVRTVRLTHQSRRARHAPGFDDAVAALRRRAFTSLDLAAFAHEFQLSPATFRRQMQAAYGVSPKTFVLQLRSARAKELLAVSGLSVEAVANAVGFEDAYYFSRVFAAREGMPPSEFRRRNQRG